MGATCTVKPLRELLVEAVPCSFDREINNRVIDCVCTKMVVSFRGTKRYDSLGIECTGNPLVLSNRFAAPELFSSKGLYCFSPKADVYALGITLFVMLKRKFPVDFRRMKGIPGNIKAVIRAATARFDNRIGSVEEFIQMLGSHE